MDNDELMKLWCAFTDIPIDEEECIDKLLPNGIQKLLYKRIPKTNYP